MKDRTLDTYLSSLVPVAQSCFPPSNQSSSASASTPGICTIATHIVCINKFKQKAQDFMLKKNISYLCLHLLQSLVTFSLHYPSSIYHPFTVHIAPVPSSYAVSCSTPTWWPTHPGPAIRNCPPSGSTTEQLNCQKF